MDGIAEPVTETPYSARSVDPTIAAGPRTSPGGWLLRESPHIAMLVLAVIGISFPVPVTYWLVITPVFALISILSGWRHFGTAQDHLRMVALQVLSWSALVLAIYALYNDGSEGVLNANALSLAMITLLALGTFLAGLHAHSWRTCVVGIILFVAVPVLGWLDQTSILLFIGAVVIVAIAGGTWFLLDRRQSAI
jgi:hypothetical protein